MTRQKIANILTDNLFVLPDHSLASLASNQSGHLQFYLSDYTYDYHCQLTMRGSNSTPKLI